MTLSKANHSSTTKIYYRNSIALLLVMAFAINLGHQLSNSFSDPLVMEVYDLSDIGTECDEKEKEVGDDVIKLEHKNSNAFLSILAGYNVIPALNYPPNHLETPTPPPEHSL